MAMVPLLTQYKKSFLSVNTYNEESLSEKKSSG
jgi:hypothetical protein